MNLSTSTLVAIIAGLGIGGIVGWQGADRLASIHFGNSGLQKNGWSYAVDWGRAEPPSLGAAAAAKHVMMANVAEEAVYYKQFGDASNGESFTIHFDSDQFPPVKAFWSLTIYHGELPYNLVKNPIERSVISDRTEGLSWNDDGSLDVLIQHEQPERDKSANWLPAPDGLFMIVLRAYWPDESIIDGTYAPPPVQIVNSGRQSQ